MPKPTYLKLNECHRDPEIVSNAHLVIAEPEGVKLFAYATDDLKMKKKERKYKHYNFSTQVAKKMYLEADVMVLCVILEISSWNSVLIQDSDPSVWYLWLPSGCMAVEENVCLCEH